MAYDHFGGCPSWPNTLVFIIGIKSTCSNGTISSSRTDWKSPPGALNTTRCKFDDYELWNFYRGLFNSWWRKKELEIIYRFGLKSV